MGKVYPVTESFRSQHSLRAKKMKKGYNSHYVLVNRQGPCKPPLNMTKKFNKCSFFKTGSVKFPLPARTEKQFLLV
jgi:hypothetical protein